MDGPGGFFRRSEGKHTTPPLYCALLHVGDGGHHALFGPQRGGSSLRIDLTGILAGEDLNTGGAEQGASSKQT